MASTANAEELIVEANKTFFVGEDQQNLQLDSLIIGDNARIEFSPSVDHWYVDAVDAQIGKNVVIDGRGETGRSGESGQSFNQLIEDTCEPGKHGSDGGSGEPGGNGVDVRLRMGLSRLDGLAVITTGGDGGRGGDGGQGQSKSNIKSCDAATGGNGGSSGSGGNGGNGGHVRISVWASDTDLNIDGLLAKISTEALGGKGGEAGVAGEAGEGSAGEYITRKTLAGNRKWVAGADPGSDGLPGHPGELGRSGIVEIEKAFDRPSISVREKRGSSLNVDTATSTNSNRNAEIKAIRNQLLELLKRLDALENE